MCLNVVKAQVTFDIQVDKLKKDYIEFLEGKLKIILNREPYKAIFIGDGSVDRS